MLSERSQLRLREASQFDSDVLNDVIASIRKCEPQAFHDEESLAGRRFFNQPAQAIPMASFEVKRPEPKVPAHAA